MPSSTIRVDPTTLDRLRAISKEKKQPIGQIVAELLDRYARDKNERDRFWQEVHEDFGRLRADPVAWAEYQNPPPYYSPEELAELEAEDARNQDRTVPPR